MTRSKPISVFHARRCRLLLGSVAFLMALAAHPAQAQDVVSDGGFEQATVGPQPAGQSLGDGWIVTQGHSGAYNNSDYVYDGSRSLAVADEFNGSQGAVSQTLSTTPGQSYVLSFYADSDKANTLSVFFNGQSVFSGEVPVKYFALGGGGQNPSAPYYTFYSFTVTASLLQTPLSFQGQSPAGRDPIGGSVVIDDVSVVPAPEPSDLVSLSVGAACLLAVWGTARRLRKV